jgi:hypothetical protein
MHSYGALRALNFTDGLNRWTQGKERPESDATEHNSSYSEGQRF